MFTILGLSDISEPAVHAGPIIAASFPPKTATPSEESNTLYIDSAVSDHDATVDVQLWDERPTQPPEHYGWDAVTQVEATCTTGVLEVAMTTRSPEDWQVEVPPGRYHIAVLSRGRETVRHAVQEWMSALDEYGDGPDNVTGIEQYLIQLWRPSSISIA
jgi:hypothetical protein